VARILKAGKRRQFSTSPNPPQAWEENTTRFPQIRRTKVWVKRGRRGSIGASGIAIIGGIGGGSVTSSGGYGGGSRNPQKANDIEPFILSSKVAILGDAFPSWIT